MKALELIRSNTDSGLLPTEVVQKIKDIPAEPAKKIDHLATSLNQIESLISALKAQEATLAAKRKALENLVDQAHDKIIEEMASESMVEMQGELIKFSTSRSNPKLIIEDEKLIPEIFKSIETKVETIIDKEEIKAHLKNNIGVIGARLEYGTTLKIGYNKGKK